MGIDHSEYDHAVKVETQVRDTLLADLD
jgi:hypothetical protein